MANRQKSIGAPENGRQSGQSGNTGAPSSKPAELSLAVLKHAPVFVAVCDANFSPIFLNRTGRDLVGLPRDADIESLKFTDFFVPESQAIIDDIVFPTVIRARRWKGELKVRHFADATQNKAVPWSIFGIFGPDGEFIGGGCIASDISALEHSQSERLDEKPRRSSMTPEYLAGQRGLHGDRTMSVENLLVLTGEEPEPEDCDGTAARLRLYEAKLREASDLFGLAVYSWNPVSDALEWDDRLRAMWGLPAGEPVDRLAFEAGIHPDDRERVDQAITACLDPSGDGRYDIEYRVIGRDDGVERYVSTSGQTTFEQGKATAFIGAVVDVSENRRAEASIRASEARFRAFAEYSANLLWIINPVSNMIEYRSPAYERIWGEPIQDAPKGLDDWLARIHPDDLQSVCAALESVKAGELILHEYRIIRPDGSVRWLRDTSFPIRGDVGQVPRIGGIIEDLTLYDGNHVYTLGKPGAEFGRLTNMLRGAGFQVRSFESTSALIDIAPVLTPGCVLIDLRMKATDGMQIPRELKARAVTLPTVVIGPEIADPDSIIAAMKAGASDYLIPPFEDDRLKAAVASAMAEMHGLGRIHSTAMESATRVARLTVREREVLEGLVKGGTNKTIAKELGISPRTVELYRSQVMNRLDASDLPELIQIALAAGVRPRSEVNRPAARSARNPT